MIANEKTMTVRITFLRPMKRRTKQDGWSLLELSFSILIIGVISAIAIPQFLMYRPDAKTFGDRRTERFAHRVRRAGFSLIEITLALAILLILAGFAIPNIASALHQAKFRGAVSDFTGLLQSGRIYAIRDNRFYSVYVLGANSGNPQAGYVDMLPASATGASGNGGTSLAPGDPLVTIPTEVTQQPAASAPNTANLESQLLPSNTPVTPTDATITPFTFGPRGLPCLVVQLTGGAVCNSLGGPVAYWIFFQDSQSKSWEAVTATPAGRIRSWSYNGSTWNKM
jgi:prepilin-type N-terminal cleavage/methylation domain-containing protein